MKVGRGTAIGAAVLVMVAGFATLSVAAESPVPGQRHCPRIATRDTAGEIVHATKIVVRQMGCRRANKVIRGFHAQIIGSSGSGYAAGFGCGYLSADRVRCGPGPSGTEGPQRVEWVARASAGRAILARASRCLDGAAGEVGDAAALKASAQGYWGQFLSVSLDDWSIASLRCGQLTPTADEEIVVVLTLDSGTGSSPRSWGIYDRADGGALDLAHFDPGRRLVCPTTTAIDERVLEIYRASRYEGAYTLCDQIASYRWRNGRYVEAIRPAYRRCSGTPVEKMFTATEIRVSRISCESARSMLRNSSLSGSLHCISVPGRTLTQCVSTRDPRRWLSYVIRS